MAAWEQWFEVDLQIAGNSVELLAFSLQEALSSVSRLSATLVTREGAPLPEASSLVGADVSFVIKSWTDTERHFTGFVLSALDRRAADERTIELVMVSKLARLELRKDCRNFRKSPDSGVAPDAIVKEVLVAAGVADSEQNWVLKETHPDRIYTVQYRETDLAFITRTLAEEGIYYAHRFSADGLKLHFSDDTSGLADVAGQKALTFQLDLGVTVQEECLVHVSQRRARCSDKVSVRGRDFKTPDVMFDDSAESEDPGAHAFEVYDYSVRVENQSDAKRHAQKLLEALQADRLTVEGETTSLRLLPGSRFDVEDHPWAKLNGELLVVRSNVAGRDVRRTEDGAKLMVEAKSVQSWFEGVPTARTKYRPAPQEVALRVAGLQSTMTTGASGSEIHVDAHGRVTAHFHWDRTGALDDNASCWMRTSQMPLTGAMLIPRVGWEVSVAYSEGDPDRPYVMQRLYNTATPPPYALPEHKASMALQTATTPGGGSSNEFSMSDTKGSEGMFFNGSKDMSISVNNNATESIKNNQKVTIGSNHALHVSGAVTSTIGADEKVTVSGNQDHSVGALLAEDSGSHSMTVGGNRNLSIGGDHRRTVAGPSSLTVGGNSIDLVAGSVFESTLASMTHTVGSALVELSVGSRSVIVGGASTETTGALKVIVAKKGRGLEAAAYSNLVGGASVAIVKGDRVDTSKASYTDVAAGLQITKAENITFEADALITVQMGAASLILTPASVSLTGAAITLDGDTIETGGMIMDN
ncbi:MAG TPA: type VI secretion system tip protein TssI/VgrG [Polyangiaceae bacterium]|nr:type VI secretion system tip protein TssI/VgrG [Polyangiaceae bacterium]